MTGKYPGENKILNQQKIERPKRRLKQWTIPVTVALLLLVITVPAVLVGEDIGFRELLVRMRLLEIRMHRVPALSEYKLPAQVSLCGHEFSLERPEIRESLENEFYISLGSRASVILWIKRSGRYFPHIEKRLEDLGMPDDLKYLAVAESDLRPRVGSPAGAVGIWQFIESTGRSHGLRVDYHIDDRRDFHRSTEAALAFLTELNKQFDNWLLAMASYNAGPGRVSREIKRQEVISYFDLDLPRETERYIFRIAAIKVIMENPAKYGVDLLPGEKYTPVEFDTVTVAVTARSIDLAEIASAAGITTRQLTDLNKAFVSSSLPRGSHYICLPKGVSRKFIDAWNKRRKDSASRSSGNLAPRQRKITYTVRRGDTLAGIARKYNCSVDDICRWNRLNRKNVLPVGKRLIIYR